jgi:hypothetical protein
MGTNVCCACCVLSGRGLCDELNTRSRGTYRLWRVVVCNNESLWKRSPWYRAGLQGRRKWITIPMYIAVGIPHCTEGINQELYLDCILVRAQIALSKAENLLLNLYSFVKQLSWFIPKLCFVGRATLNVHAMEPNILTIWYVVFTLFTDHESP